MVLAPKNIKNYHTFFCNFVEDEYCCPVYPLVFKWGGYWSIYYNIHFLLLIFIILVNTKYWEMDLAQEIFRRKAIIFSGIL